MTDPEFKDWLKKHRSCFTGLNTWFGKLPKPGREHEGEPNYQDVFKRWYGALRDVDYADAVAATEAMFAGKFDEPKGFDRHPAAIRTYALQLRDGRNEDAAGVPRRYVDGRMAFRCAACEDEGFVPVWHPETVRKVADANEFTHPLYNAVAPCYCEMGKRRQRCFPHEGPYSERVYCKLGIGGVNDQQERELLLAWIEANMRIQPHSEFAAFSG